MAGPPKRSTGFHDRTQDDADERREVRPAGVGLRATLVGVVLAVLCALLIPYVSDVRGRPGPDLGLGWGHIPQVSVLVLLLLLGPVRWTARLARARWRLNRRDALVIYAMVTATAAIASEGFASYVVTMVTAAQYAAGSGNRWEVDVLPYIPTRLQLNNDAAVRWYWEGLPQGASVPWALWRQPLVLWGALAVCLYTAMLSLVLILRRDWIEKQRLAFPMAQIPLAIVGQAGAPVLHRPVFWIGFGVSSIHGLLLMLSSRYPSIPTLPMYYPIGQVFQPQSLPWGPLSPLAFQLNWGVLGIMCLLPAEVSLSFWVFTFWYFLQLVVLAAVGFAGPGSGAQTGFNPRDFLNTQNGGALIGLGLFSLYLSRRSVVAAVRTWWNPAWRDQDPLELVSPRVAVVGLVVALVGAGAMGWYLGVQAGRLLTLVALFLLVTVALTKVSATSGSPYIGMWPSVRWLLDRGAGTVGVRPETLVFLGQLDAVFMTEYKASFMPYAADIAKIAHTSRLRGSGLVIALGVSVIAVLLAGPLAKVWCGYQVGVASLTGGNSPWIYGSLPRHVFGGIAMDLQNPREADAITGLAVALGALWVVTLSLLHLNVSWWRLSPIGFVLQGDGGWPLNPTLWGNALVGWLIVTLICRYGGRVAYDRVRPAFFGLYLGEACATLVSSLVLLTVGRAAGVSAITI